MVLYHAKIHSVELLLITQWRHCKIEKILKGSLDSIPSPSPSVKIQIMGGEVCLRCKGKTLRGVVNKLLKTKCLLTTTIDVLPLYLSRPSFEFSTKVRVMGLNPDYLLKSFLLYAKTYLISSVCKPYDTSWYGQSYHSMCGRHTILQGPFWFKLNYRRHWRSVPTHNIFHA